MASLGANASSLSIAALFGVAAVAIVAPVRFSAAYGLPVDPGNGVAQGFVRALGARDGALAGIASCFAVRGDRRAVRITLGWAAALGIVDLSVVVCSDSRGNVSLAALASAAAFALLFVGAACE
jgi:hypothetical protein